MLPREQDLYMVCLFKCFGVKLDLTTAFEIAMLCQSLPNYIFHYSFTVLFNKHGTSVAKQRSQKKTNSLEITSPVEQIITALELRKMLSQDSVTARAETPLVLSKNH